jgi:hypothetical protein
MPIDVELGQIGRAFPSGGNMNGFGDHARRDAKRARPIHLRDNPNLWSCVGAERRRIDEKRVLPHRGFQCCGTLSHLIAVLPDNSRNRMVVEGEADIGDRRKNSGHDGLEIFLASDPILLGEEAQDEGCPPRFVRAGRRPSTHDVDAKNFRHSF